MARRPRTRGQLLAISALEILGAILGLTIVGVLAALPALF